LHRKAKAVATETLSFAGSHQASSTLAQSLAVLHLANKTRRHLSILPQFNPEAVAYLYPRSQVGKMFSKVLATAGLLASVAVGVVGAIPTIEAVGAKFFYSNGTQYYIKGMASLLIWTT
jgi:hypothetical protein